MAPAEINNTANNNTASAGQQAAATASEDSDDSHLITFLTNHSVPCPRCAYNLRDIKTAQCPECGDPLILKIASARPTFGWLIFAMAPGCFSGIAAVFLAIPICLSIVLGTSPPGRGFPWSLVAADIFGFVSAASVCLMYRHRHRVMSWASRKQALFAWIIWGIHVGMFILLVLARLYSV